MREGRVFQRNNAGRKTWAYKVDVAPSGALQRKQITRGGFKTKAEAQESLKALLDAQRSGPFIPTKITLRTYLSEWLGLMPDRGYAPSTVYSYRQAVSLHVLTSSIADLRLAQIGPKELDSLYSHLLADGRADGTGGLSKRTVRYIHSILGRVLENARTSGLISFNPARLAHPPSPRSARPPEAPVWDARQLSHFLNFIKDDFEYPIYRLFAATGMRRGEVAGLRWTNVDLEQGRLFVREAIVTVGGTRQKGITKTYRSERPISLDATTIQVLRDHRARQIAYQRQLGDAYQDHGYVFAGPNGDHLHPGRLYDRFRRRVQDSGLPRMHLHGLRHTNASLAIANLVDVKVVQERLGHSSAAFTLDRYAKSYPATHRAAAETLADLLERRGDSDENG